MPITKVKTPSGQIIKVQHPEGASRESIFKFAKQQIDRQPSEQQASPFEGQEIRAVTPRERVRQATAQGERFLSSIPVLGPIRRGARDVAQGALQLGARGVDLLTGGATDLSSSMDRIIREEEEAFQQANPDAGLTTDVLRFLGGAAAGGGPTVGGATGAALGKPVQALTGLGRASQAAGRVAGGAALGAATSPVIMEEGREGDQGEFARQKLGQFATGVATGGLIEGIGGLTRATRNILRKRPQAQTSDEIRQASRELYKIADEKGGILSEQFTNDFIAEVKRLKPQTQKGLLLEGESPLTKIVNAIEGFADSPTTLQEAQEIDQFLTQEISRFTENGRLNADGKQLFDVQTIFRRMVEGVDETKVVGGKEGFNALKKGRELWSRSRKLADIEAIIQRAQGKTQPATTLKTGFQTLRDNPKRLKSFTKDEREAIKRAAESGVTTDVFRVFGSRLMPIITGATTGGLGTTAAATLGSTASRGIGARLQADRAREVAEIVASGGRRSTLPVDTFVTGARPAATAAITRGISDQAQGSGQPQETRQQLIDRLRTQVQGGEAPQASETRQQLIDRLRSDLQGTQSPENDFTSQVIEAESGGDPEAKSRTSSASGLFQMTDSTWESLVSKYGAQEGVTKDDRGDPESERKMFDRLTDENRQSFRNSFKRDPNNTELYAMHFLGAGSGKRMRKLLDKNPNLKAADIFKPAAKSNRNIFYKNNGRGAKRTIEEVYTILQRKVS